MKFQVLQERLSKSLNLVNRFVNPRAQLPALSNIYFAADGNSLNLSATNLEMSISVSIGAKVERKGEITIPARTIVDLVSSLGSSTVNFDVAKEQVKLVTDNFQSTLAAVNTSDFPKVPNQLTKKSLSLKGSDLSDALAKVLFAVSNDETRPVLTGMLLVMDGKKMEVVATDGFRLSRKNLDLSKSVGKNKLIIPKNAMLELSRLLSGTKTVGVDMSAKDQVIFGGEEAVLSTRVIAGEFPDYQKIIPGDHKVKLSLGTEDLKRAVKLASVFARDSANVVKFKISKNSFEISAESSKAGKEKTEIDAKIESSGSVKDLEIAFNFKFLEDFLNVCGAEDMEIKLSDTNSPGVFVDTKDKDFLHLIMPVRLHN